MSKYAFSAVAGAIALVCAAAPADAAIVVVTYSGTVDSGNDRTGVFGATNADLTGAAFTSTYTFDDTKGYVANSAEQNYAYGGAIYGIESPSLGATITINGRSVSVSGASFGQILGYNNGSFSQQYSHAEAYTTENNIQSGTYLYNSTYGYNADLPASTNGAYDGPASQYSYGYFASYAYDYNTGSYLQDTNASLRAERLTVGAPAVTAAVPEPASWAMMIIGFGAVGGAMRRRPAAARKLAVRFA